MSDTKVKAKGTTKTEAIIGAASNKLVSATKNLSDAVAQALKLVETADEQALKIADNEEKLSNLQTDYANKKTQMEIDLGLEFKAGQAGFANRYLQDNGLVAVSRTENEKLKQDYQALQTEFDTKVNAEIGKAKGMAESQAKSNAALLDAQYQAKEAGNLAQIRNLESQLASVKEWNQTLQGQLNAERTASVDRAKASSVGSINVAPSNGR